MRENGKGRDDGFHINNDDAMRALELFRDEVTVEDIAAEMRCSAVQVKALLAFALNDVEYAAEPPKREMTRGQREWRDKLLDGEPHGDALRDRERRKKTPESDAQLATEDRWFYHHRYDCWPEKKIAAAYGVPLSEVARGVARAKERHKPPEPRPEPESSTAPRQVVENVPAPSEKSFKQMRAYPVKIVRFDEFPDVVLVVCGKCDRGNAVQLGDEMPFLCRQCGARLKRQAAPTE